jgi:hypothetical protein
VDQGIEEYKEGGEGGGVRDEEVGRKGQKKMRRAG